MLISIVIDMASLLHALLGLDALKKVVSICPENALQKLESRRDFYAIT